MHPAVLHVLNVVSARLSRQALANEPDFLEDMKPWGAEWRALAREALVPCPEALVELGDAMRDRLIYVTTAPSLPHFPHGHAWSLETPPRAREHRAFLKRFSLSNPELAARAKMLPIFGQDGDLLLLAHDGRVHSFTHDGFENEGVFAERFEALLETFAEGPVNL